MAIFLTGSTGYIGAHVCANLLAAEQKVNLLVRAPSPEEAEGRLWRAFTVTSMSASSSDWHSW